MKIKYVIVGMVLCLPLLFSSCRSCKGGGWYGDRNLSVDQAAIDQDLTICLPEE